MTWFNLHELENNGFRLYVQKVTHPLVKEIGGSLVNVTVEYQGREVTSGCSWNRCQNLAYELAFNEAIERVSFKTLMKSCRDIPQTHLFDFKSRAWIPFSSESVVFKSRSTSSGSAVGKTLQDALTRAWLELVERDFILSSYLFGGGACFSPAHQDLLAALGAAGLHDLLEGPPLFANFSSVPGVAVELCVLKVKSQSIGKVPEQLFVGSAAGLCQHDAKVGALREATQTFLSTVSCGQAKYDSSGKKELIEALLPKSCSEEVSIYLHTRQKRLTENINLYGNFFAIPENVHDRFNGIVHLFTAELVPAFKEESAIFLPDDLKGFPLVNTRPFFN